MINSMQTLDRGQEQSVSSGQNMVIRPTTQLDGIGMLSTLKAALPIRPS